jgi:hypothetical protein
VLIVTRAIGGKHGDMSEMRASACGQGRQDPGQTALGMSGMWLSIYADDASWQTAVAKIAGDISLLPRYVHERLEQDVWRADELSVEMDPALCHRSR